jgi:hypothetical protein
VYEYVNNTYTNRIKQMGGGWSGYILGGPKQIAEAALKMLPFQSTLYSAPNETEQRLNTNKDAVDAQIYSERVRSELYKAILDMRQRKKAMDAVRELSRPSPNGGYKELISIELRTRVDLILDIVYTVSRDWEENRPSPIQIINYKRSRNLLAAAVANDILWTRINTLATPKSRMDRKDIFQARGAAINALARISTDEIRISQYSYDDSNYSGGGSLFISGNFNPIQPGGSIVPTVPSTTARFSMTSGSLPISNRL